MCNINERWEALAKQNPIKFNVKPSSETFVNITHNRVMNSKVKNRKVKIEGNIGSV